MAAYDPLKNNGRQTQGIWVFKDTHRRMKDLRFDLHCDTFASVAAAAVEALETKQAAKERRRRGRTV